MYASTTFDLAWVPFQQYISSWSRVSTSSGRRIRASSRSNSRADSEISTLPRQTRCVERSSRRSPTSTVENSGQRRSPGECPQAREQLLERERLGQIVVRARLQAGDQVGGLTEGGQHQHRHRVALLAEPAAQRQTVDAGQHPIQHDGVIRLLGRHRQAALASVRDIRVEALLAQAGHQQRGHLYIVFNNQHAHGGQLSQRTSDCARSRVSRWNKDGGLVIGSRV